MFAASKWSILSRVHYPTHGRPNPLNLRQSWCTAKGSRYTCPCAEFYVNSCSRLQLRFTKAHTHVFVQSVPHHCSKMPRPKIPDRFYADCIQAGMHNVIPCSRGGTMSTFMFCLEFCSWSPQVRSEPQSTGPPKLKRSSPRPKSGFRVPPSLAEAA